MRTQLLEPVEILVPLRLEINERLRCRLLTFFEGLAEMFNDIGNEKSALEAASVHGQILVGDYQAVALEIADFLMTCAGFWRCVQGRCSGWDESITNLRRHSVPPAEGMV